MCLTLAKQFKSEKEAKAFVRKPLVSKRNIKVYKMLETCEDEILSPYQSETYTEGELKTVKRFTSRITGSCYCSIERGLHTYATLKEAKTFAKLGVSVAPRFVIEVMIPKGTPYFKSVDDKQYVSLALQMPKKFKSLYGKINLKKS